MSIIKRIVKNILPYYVVKSVQEKNRRKERLIELKEYPIELTEDEKKLIDHVVDNNLTYVSRERLFATLMSCKYILQNNIDGDFVECGVWRGGNSIIAAGIFKMYNSCKKVYLYDTFQGMTAPTDADILLREDGISAREILNATELDKNKKWAKNTWCYASIDDVKTNFSNLDLLSENVKFIQGDILQTLDTTIPDKISVLRLDTDWYESTKKEMDVLYERIVPNGVLMVDDYGHWAGSKKAVDEYFLKNNNRPFLQYIDYTGRLGIKSV